MGIYIIKSENMYLSCGDYLKNIKRGTFLISFYGKPVPNKQLSDYEEMRNLVVNK
jgi:hypothetical protein